MIWLAMGMAMAAAAWLAWRVLAWSGPAARRYRAVYTQQAGAHLSEVFLFVDPAQLWAAALAMAAAGAAAAWVFSGSAWLAAVAAVALLRLPHLLLGAARRRRLRQLERQLPGALVAMACALRAGARPASSGCNNGSSVLPATAGLLLVRAALARAVSPEGKVRMAAGRLGNFGSGIGVTLLCEPAWGA